MHSLQHAIHMLWQESWPLMSGFLEHSWEHTYPLWLPPPQVLFKCTPPFYTFKQAPRFNMVGVYFCVLNRLLRSFVYISVPIQIISTVTLLLVVHLKQCMAEPTWQCIYLFLFLVFLSQSGKFLGLCTLKCVLYVFFKLSALELFVNCWKWGCVWHYEAPMQYIRAHKNGQCGSSNSNKSP